MSKIQNIELKLDSRASVILNALSKSYLSSLSSNLITVSLKWSKVFVKRIHVTQQSTWCDVAWCLVEDNDVDCAACGDGLFESIYAEVISAIIFGGNHS